MKIKIKHLLMGFVSLTFMSEVSAQQAPEYTQYMYNTMSINPGYTGSTEGLNANLLYRSQWVGMDGAPKTGNFGIHGPLANQRMGLGLNVVSDKIGPSNDVSATANFSYNINISTEATLGLGINAGARVLNIDWSKGRYLDNNDVVIGQNLDNKFLPVVGAGAYLFTDRFYVGLSVPNFLRVDYYDDIQQSTVVDELHYYLIAGYVFDISENVKFKPSAMVKAVSGAPLAYDVSANFLFSEKFTVGAAYRWDDSVSGLVGFQITPSVFIGYSYDYTTSEFTKYNNGSHEAILRFQINKKGSNLKSPRFF
ncbi:MAG: type IX secretion system membrane protein PorP/SprF [Flavobacterium sp.]|nr:type IX secretion system membrane protein PorP/SprF [Candidatus Neoflavobacterium equi]